MLPGKTDPQQKSSRYVSARNQKTRPVFRSVLSIKEGIESKGKVASQGRFYCHLLPKENFSAYMTLFIGFSEYSKPTEKADSDKLYKRVDFSYLFYQKKGTEGV